MTFAHILGIEDAAIGSQWIDGGINTLFRNRAFQIDEGIQMRESIGGGGSVGSSAGTYTACTLVMAPRAVEVMRSCNSPISVASVG